jgi:hypothetical protein
MGRDRLDLGDLSGLLVSVCVQVQALLIQKLHRVEAVVVHLSGVGEQGLVVCYHEV